MISSHDTKLPVQSHVQHAHQSSINELASELSYLHSTKTPAEHSETL